MIERYYFDDVDEDEHRFSRNSNFFVSTCVAVLPFAINLIWRTYEGDNENFFEAGITDLAFAGVVIAISMYTNTYFSIKLAGWKTLSRWTFAAFMFVVLSAILSFVAYLQAAHNQISPDLLDDVFWATFSLVIANIILSYIAQYCFLSDEFRNARNHIQALPPKYKKDILT